MKRSFKRWTEHELDILKTKYPSIGLRATAEMLNRPCCQIRSQASRFGLKQDRKSEFFTEWQRRARMTKIGKKRPVHSKIMREKYQNGFTHLADYVRSEVGRKCISERAKLRIKEKGHPRGMLGKKHSDELKKKFSELSKERWADPNSFFNSKENRQRLSDAGRKTMEKRLKTTGSVYSRAKCGWFKINGKEYYFRSSWEVVYARYLEHLRKNTKDIKRWSYEPDTFWFENIRRGVRSYTPDFKVEYHDGLIEYHEVKGWLDSKSITKLKRINKYHPDIKLILVDKEVYYPIEKKSSSYPPATFVKKKNEA